MGIFEPFFAQATGCLPHEYQARVARDGLPGMLRAPAGSSHGGVILAWLWRRLYGADPVRAGTRSTALPAGRDHPAPGR